MGKLCSCSKDFNPAIFTSPSLPAAREHSRRIFLPGTLALDQVLSDLGSDQATVLNIPKTHNAFLASEKLRTSPCSLLRGASIIATNHKSVLKETVRKRRLYWYWSFVNLYRVTASFLLATSASQQQLAEELRFVLSWTCSTETGESNFHLQAPKEFFPSVLQRGFFSLQFSSIR